MFKKYIPIIGFGFITIIFFWQFFLKGLIPIPTDTIVGLYHPYRDFYAKDYSNGIPFKNFLITDPVRQQYPWRNLSINAIKNKNLPVWNPYSLSGTPLIANFQSATFYPINIMFLVLPFTLSWVFLIMAQVFLAGTFLYLYLKNLKIDTYSSIFGGIIFAFGGFFASWLEWGTVLHTALWLPLILLSVDKLSKLYGDKNKTFIWSVILIFSLSSSFFAGHLQSFFYLLIFSLIYSLIRIWQYKKSKIGIILLINLFIVLLISSIQLIPTLEFIGISARGIDQILWQKDGWFIPWEHLVQFIAPDFFGNPSTLNYWGTWNYGELTAYVSIAGLIFALYALFFRKDKKTFFYGLVLFISLFLALPTFLAKLPFILNIPFISTAQPTRLIFIIDFSIAVLSALGLNYLIKSKIKKEILFVIGFITILFGLLLGFVLIGERFGFDQVNLQTAKRNLVLPFILFIGVSSLIILFIKANTKFRNIILLLIIVITIFDLFRFSLKFNTFSKSEYLYPNTKSIDFISNNIGNYRTATTDSRILPPNFSNIYMIQSVEGYDPLFLSRYAEFISAINRNEPNIEPPFGFNRIVRLENINSDLVDLLGVKYVLSLTDININSFKKVFVEGETKVYENTKVLPRTFFVDEVELSRDKNQTINELYSLSFDPLKTAIVEGSYALKRIKKGEAKIILYSENKVVIETQNDSDGFLVLTDSFYPSWHAKINNLETNIYLTDYIFRGIFVPSGNNQIIFYNNLL